VLWFYDTTRNGTRRWCSMAICGNRAKAHRHYDRVKKTR
jgi:predicted RNA-binding Zn ribbon-like protein